MTPSAAARVQAAPGRQLSTTLAGEVVILDIERGTYFGLTEVGAHIWGMIQEPRKIAEVVDGVVAVYDVTRETAEADVTELIADLASRGLVDVDPATGT
jgi:hypothetical protein